VPELLAEWIALDERYQGDRPGARAVRVLKAGEAAVVFTAPHAVRHLRRGQLKKADIRTGGLAELLALRTGGAAVTSLGRLALEEGDYTTAQSRYAEGLALRRRLGAQTESRFIIAISLISLGEVARCQGDDERAAALFEEALLGALKAYFAELRTAAK